METWREVWRRGIAPLLPTEGLLSLAEALLCDSPMLLQGAICSPPPLQVVLDWSVEGADPIVWCHAATNGGISNVTVAVAEEAFAQTCFECDNAMGEPAACRHFLAWWDDSPRSEVVPALLAEVRHELAIRNPESVGLAADTPREIVSDYLEEQHAAGVAAAL